MELGALQTELVKIMTRGYAYCMTMNGQNSQKLKSFIIHEEKNYPVIQGCLGNYK